MFHCIKGIQLNTEISVESHIILKNWITIYWYVHWWWLMLCSSEIFYVRDIYLFFHILLYNKFSTV
jgi:hypothetical protein